MSALGHSDQPNEEPMGGIRPDEQLSGQRNLPQENVTSPLHNINYSYPLIMPLTASQDPGETASSHCSTQRGQLPGARIASPGEQQTSSSDITVLDMLHSTAFTSDLEGDALPALPSSKRARELVDMVYFYTQARYCIIDWTRLCEWHRDREAIAYTSTEDSVTSQTGKYAFEIGASQHNLHSGAGAFFIWIIYAIGACLVSNTENSTEVGNKYLVARREEAVSKRDRRILLALEFTSRLS